MFSLCRVLSGQSTASGNAQFSFFFSFILFVRADIQTTSKKWTSQHHREERAQRLWRLKVQPRKKNAEGEAGRLIQYVPSKCRIFFWLPISCRRCCCCTWQHIPTRLLFIIFFVFLGSATIVGWCCSGNEKNGHLSKTKRNPSKRVESSLSWRVHKKKNGYKRVNIFILFFFFNCFF